MTLLSLKKSNNRPYAVVGDLITFTLQAENISNYMLSQIVVYDALPSQLEFVKGSVVVDSVAKPELNILAGIPVKNLLPGKNSIVQFQAKVLNDKEPNIENVATVEFEYTPLGGVTKQGSSESNVNTVKVFTATMNVSKKADQEAASLQDIITYTVTLTNTGDVTEYGIVFKDYLPKETVLVPGSFKIGATRVNSVNLETGIIVGSLVPNESIVLTYQAKVIGSNCSGILSNAAEASFKYRLPNGQVGTGVATGEESVSEVMLEITTFKQMSIETYLRIPEVKPNIETINTMTGSIDQLACHVIETVQGKSTEGQNLTGYKLIIRGQVNLVIEYTALEETQHVHSAHYTVPFSTFIILPADYEIGSKIEITGMIEDIYYNAIDIRTFFANITALLNAKILRC